jgi:multimeric flavodoxin WrbA
MQKILGVVGSPRKNGNTDILVTRVLAGAESVGAITNLVRLGELSIKECDGCHVCWNGQRCSKNDDLGELYTEISRSELIVLGTPVYWYGPTALMKGFIDRWVYFNCPVNRVHVRGKSVVIVIPYEEEGPEIVAPVVSFFEKCCEYLEMNLFGKLIVPGVGRRGEVLEKESCMKEAFELGKRLVATSDRD